MNDRPIISAPRDVVVRALARGLSFQGRKRTHQAEDLMAVIAAERLADHLARQNLFVVEGPPAPNHAGPPPAHSALREPGQ